ncbi:MAG: type II CAAX endopeptidase family protein [Candidatus Verstraetearchaeota archaeon]|nr:type II CAAX endopeptidase family protein [Candidatus Verstraetearchaeota archaeon]
MGKFVVFYFILVLVIGGLAYAPWVLASYGMFPTDLVFPFVVIGGVSPTVAALAVAKLEFGRGGAGYLFGQFVRRGFSKLWFLVAILLPLSLAIGAVLLWSLVGGTFNLDLKFFEFIPILLTAFLMNMWEEVGWRGYSLPALQKKYSALTSSLIVGVFWALWHWPHFAVKDSVMAVNYQNFLWFAIFTLFYSVTYTWLYNSTKGSLLTVTLYHASTNTANTILFVEGGIAVSVFPFYFLLVIVLALVVVFVFKQNFWSMGRVHIAPNPPSR